MTIKEKYRSEMNQISLSDDNKQNLVQKSIAVSQNHSSSFFTFKHLVTALSSVCILALILLSAYFVFSGSVRPFFESGKNLALSEDSDKSESYNTNNESTPVWSVSSEGEFYPSKSLSKDQYYNLLIRCIPDKLILSQPDENGVYFVYSYDRTSVAAIIVPSDYFSDFSEKDESKNSCDNVSIDFLDLIIINQSLDSETFNHIIQTINNSIANY